MVTVKEIREERKAGKATKDKLKAHVKFYFAHRLKMTIGEDVGFRSELRSYTESLGLNLSDLNEICQELEAVDKLVIPDDQPSTSKSVSKKA